MSEAQDQDQAQLYQQIIEKCCTDDSFKQQLLAEPMTTLKAEGLDLPEDLSVKVLENTGEVVYMVIPPKPLVPLAEAQDEDQAQLYQQIIAKCWADDSFKQQLLNDTSATLKAEGVEIPEGYSVKVLENTPQTFHIVIPNTSAQLTDDQLDDVTGGFFPFLIGALVSAGVFGAMLATAPGR